MQTQRINTYATQGIPVFYIEQYNPKLKEWFTVGDTYEKIEHALIIVESHNLKEIVKVLA